MVKLKFRRMVSPCLSHLKGGPATAPMDMVGTDTAAAELGFMVVRRLVKMEAPMDLMAILLEELQREKDPDCTWQAWT